MWKRLLRLWSVVRGDAVQLWYALRHPQSPLWLKAGCLGLVAYLFLPVDVIPDVIPVLGLADDLVLIPLVMRWLLRWLPPHIREHARQRAQGARPEAAQVIDSLPRGR